MARQHIRDMKRSLSKASLPDADDAQRLMARESALALLARSIQFGHARLAVIRLSMAVYAGADVPWDHWIYCEQAMQQSKDQALKQLWMTAAEMAAARDTPRSRTAH